MQIKTRYNLIKLVLEDDDFYDENLQHLLHQPYVNEVYLRWISENEYKETPEFYKAKKLERKKR